MPTSPAAIFSNVGRSDPLEFWSKHGLNYKRIADFLDLDAGELSRLSGVSQKSVRLDARIPRDLKERLDEIANICTLVAEYFGGDAQRTAMWFTLRNPMLGDTAPRDMIRAGRAAKLLRFIMEARDANTGRGT
jgi:hypothetical protein